MRNQQGSTTRPSSDWIWVRRRDEAADVPARRVYACFRHSGQWMGEDGGWQPYADYVEVAVPELERRLDALDRGMWGITADQIRRTLAQQGRAAAEAEMEAAWEGYRRFCARMSAGEYGRLD